MSTSTEDRQPASAYPGLRGMVARHPATAFLVMAFGFGWMSLVPILLSENGFGVVPIELPLTLVQTLATLLGLALPAFLVTAATGGREGVRDLLSRLLRWRVGVRWYLVAIFGLFVAVLLAAVPFLGAAPLEALAQRWGLLFTVFLPGVVLPFLHTNLWEELGWTGYLQSTLQERRGPLLASLIVAPFFALFHLPALFVSGWIMDEGLSLSQFPDALVQIGFLMVFAVFVRVLIMWLYNGSGRSILIVGLTHAALNVVTGQKVMVELLAGINPNLLAAAVVAVLGVLVVVSTKGRLGYEPEREAPRQAEAVSGPAPPPGP